MNNFEMNKEIEREAERKFIEWSIQELMKNAGVEFTEEEVRTQLEKYLVKEGKNILELTEEDKTNVMIDIMQSYL